MTIEFNCPNCNSVIAFPDKHAGKRAKCTTCWQSFVIPNKSHDKAEKIKPPKEEKGEPIPGFYRAVFIDNWKIFFNLKNITGFVFIFVATVFWFFNANRNFTISFTTRGGGTIDIFVPFGWLCTGISWGFLFWYYREIIYATGFDQDNFPEVILGGLSSFAWKIFQSVYTLFIILVVVGWHVFILYFILEKMNLKMPVLFYSFLALGVFLLPAAIMNIAIGFDLTLLRPDYFLIMIFRDFKAYFVTFIFIGIAMIIQIYAKPYNPTKIDIGSDLLLNCVAQLAFVFAMRVIGLYYRHYSCHAPW